MSLEETAAAATLTALTGSARAVFRSLVLDGPATRPQIGALLGLSRPTMSAAIAELERPGYVEMIGMVRGALGRGAARYRVGQAAGHVIAVDAGSTHVSLRVSTLDRRLLHSRARRFEASHHAINAETSRIVAEEVAAARQAAEPGWGPLRVLGIAVPTRVVGPEGDARASRQDVVFSAFRPPPGAEIVLENNVNCAAVAERLYGAAQDEATFAYVQVGLKIGMGLVIGDQLIRGRNGAAGEIGHLSFPFGPGLDPQPGAAELYLGSEALLDRIRAGWPAGAGPAPTDTAALFALAEAGHPVARDHVAGHAAAIGAIVASCVSVIDPGVVVLGGGLGASPLLLPGVRATVERLSYAAEIRGSLLGLDATVLGIERLAIVRALAHILDDPRA